MAEQTPIKARYLHVEDDRNMAETLKDILEFNGYRRSAWTQTIKETQERAENGDFEGSDFAVLDHSLPDGFGSEAAQILINTGYALLIINLNTEGHSYGNAAFLKGQTEPLVNYLNGIYDRPTS